MSLRAIVVGAGIAGLVNGLLLQKAGYHVDIVEAAPEAGGLLRSWQSPEGLTFDYGTHFLRETGLPDLDAVLLPPDLSNWHDLPIVSPGHYSYGQLNTASSNIDARSLPPATYLQGVTELFEQAATQPSKPFATLEAELQATYGASLTQELFTPVLTKLFNCPPNKLAAGAQRLFGLSRIIMLSENASRLLKQIPELDSRLAFHSAKEGASTLKSYYPQAGGIGHWVEDLVNRFQTQGGQLHLNTHIKEVRHTGDKITGLVTQTNQTLDAQLLVWTVPLHLLAKAAHINLPPSPQRVEFRQTTLVHLALDRPFECPNHYLSVYDPALKSFRITLYSNLDARPAHAGPYRCTVEFLHSEPLPTEIISLALKELREMGISHPSSTAVYSHVMPLGNTFPVLTPEFLAHCKTTTSALRDTFSNIILCGRGTGEHFFMHDILIDLFTQHQRYLRG